MDFGLDLYMEANNMNLNQTAPCEQSDQGSYYLQYRLPQNISRREEQTVKVVVGGKRVMILTPFGIRMVVRKGQNNKFVKEAELEISSCSQKTVGMMLQKWREKSAKILCVFTEHQMGGCKLWISVEHKWLKSCRPDLISLCSTSKSFV